MPRDGQIHWSTGVSALLDIPEGLGDAEELAVTFCVEPVRAVFRLAVLSSMPRICQRPYVHFEENFAVRISRDECPATVIFFFERQTSRTPNKVEVVSIDPLDEATWKEFHHRGIVLH